MTQPTPGVQHGILAIILLAAVPGMLSSARAGDIDEAEQLFSDHCAVCHGADRGGYIGPALNSEETKLTEFMIRAKILTGGVGTLMPQHPKWGGTLSSKEIDQLASLISKQPKRQVSWGLEDIRRSLEVYVADESTLPDKPVYPIENLDDREPRRPDGGYRPGKLLGGG
jgi:mono/diheme cytochrome c family protein